MARTKINGDQLGDTGGVWANYTPTISSVSGSFTTVSATGRYKQIGKTVFYMVAITITTVGTATDTRFTFPVTASTLYSYIGSGREDAVTGKMLQVKLQSSTVGSIQYYDNTASAASGLVLRIEGFYEAA